MPDVNGGAGHGTRPHPLGCTLGVHPGCALRRVKGEARCPGTLGAVALVIPILATFGITEGIPGMALIQSQTGEDGVLLGPAIRSRVLLRKRDWEG